MCPAFPRSLLLVDDQRPDVLLVQAVLDDVAPDVHLDVASSTETTLAHLTHQLPDLVLLSTKLAAGNGLDVLRALRAQASHPRVVMWSAHWAPSDRDGAHALGAEATLQKPTGYADLEALLRTLLGR